MKTIKLHGRKIVLYDSIEEMPITTFIQYNRNLLIDAGVGSDVDSIDSHISKIAKYIASGDKENGLKELENMRLNIYMVNSKISPKYLAFAALIKSIDGVEVTDHSDENLKRILSDINTMKHTFLLKVLDDIKKKTDGELRIYFSDMFNNAKEKEVRCKLKQRIMLTLESIEKGSDNNANKIGDIDSFLFSLCQPQLFLGTDSAEVKYNKQFEIVCVYIAQNTNLNAKDMTVLQFYTTLQTIENQSKAEQRILKR